MADEHTELLKWRTRVDDFMNETVLQRRITAMQMGALEKSVLELQADVKESSEWSKKNHDTLMLVMELCQNMENARKVADAMVKWGQPFAIFFGAIATVIVFLKTGKWTS